MSLREQLTAKPWITQRGAIADSKGLSGSTPKVALGAFIGVASVLFGLFIAAYFIRMGYSDWRSLPIPALLWLNTVVLIGGSIFMQWSMISARHSNQEGMRFGLYLGGGCAIVFLVGQWLAWQQLGQLGYFVDSNPSNGFFYMLTAVHGLHLIGGLVAWIRAVIRVHGKGNFARIRMILELCAIYWHFLLIVWFILFGLMIAT